MRSLDNVFRVLSEATAQGLNLSRLAVTAWHDVSRLDAAVVHAFGYRPDTTVDDIIPKAIVGDVKTIVGAHCYDTRAVLDAEDARACEDEYVDLIRRATDIDSTRALNQARTRIRAAIRLSVSARLDCVTLTERYRRTPNRDSLSFVTEVADYYRDYKQQCSLLDAADMLATHCVVPDLDCQLCLIDPHGFPKLGIKALRRLLPNAFFCVVYPDSS